MVKEQPICLLLLFTYVYKYVFNKYRITEFEHFFSPTVFSKCSHLNMSWQNGFCSCSALQAVFADGLDSEDGLLRSTRSRSISAPEDDSDGIAAASDDSFEFMEMSSIPPLPIYALMAADADNTGANLEIAGTTEPSNQTQDYTDLFSTYKEETLDLSDDASKLKRHHSSSNNPQVRSNDNDTYFKKYICFIAPLHMCLFCFKCQFVSFCMFFHRPFGSFHWGFITWLSCTEIFAFSSISFIWGAGVCQWYRILAWSWHCVMATS